MRITLKIRSYCTQPPADPKVRVFDSFPVIVGRSSACNYILNDASRYISSNHAAILLEGDKLLIQDTSSNGVYLNGDAEPVGRGNNNALNHEDTLAIGDYTLIVAVESTNPSASGGNVDDPFAGFPLSSSAQSVSSAPAAYDPFKGDEPDWTPASSKTDDLFADDWDINEKPALSQNSAPVSNESDWSDWPSDSSSASGSSFASRPSQPHAPATSSSTNDDFDWLPGTGGGTVPMPNPAAGASGSTQPASPSRPQPRQAARAPRPPYSNINQQPPAAAPAHRPAARRNTGSEAGSPSPLETLLSAASLRGSDFDHRDSAEVLEQTGRLLAQMTDAMMALLQSRMELKNAIRIDATTLSRSGNNPLKFSHSTSDALTKLLADNTDGYLQSERAIQEAVEDLKLHQLAMLEGMKSAVKSLLLEFDPDKLANTLGKSGGFSANIPITREAKLWQLFCNQYDTICEEAVGDFSDLFGAEFRKAYETSIKKAGRRPDF
ncbi:MAG: type VI secretion system protein [Porticoccaceae bacterium]|jgi:type VI secretion system protein